MIAQKAHLLTGPLVLSISKDLKTRKGQVLGIQVTIASEHTISIKSMMQLVDVAVGAREC